MTYSNTLTPDLNFSFLTAISYTYVLENCAFRFFFPGEGYSKDQGWGFRGLFLPILINLNFPRGIRTPTPTLFRSAPVGITNHIPMSDRNIHTMFIHVYATTTQILCLLCSLSFYFCRAWCMKGTCILSLSIYFFNRYFAGGVHSPTFCLLCSGVWQGSVFSHCRFIFLTSILQKRAFTHFFFIFVVVHGRGVYSSTDFDA